MADKASLKFLKKETFVEINQVSPRVAALNSITPNKIDKTTTDVVRSPFIELNEYCTSIRASISVSDEYNSHQPSASEILNNFCIHTSM